MKNIEVRNMTSNSGNKIANQFLIFEKNKTYFQSYSSLIICEEYKKVKIDGIRCTKRVVTLDPKFWDYSVTTGKYRNKFLNETKKETEAKLKSGEYKLKNLN
jgi:hypothetical protein